MSFQSNRRATSLTTLTANDTSIVREVEENGGRRKRRRTRSPESQTTAQNGCTTDSWENQLRAAAQAKPSVPQAKQILSRGSSSPLANGGTNLNVEGLSSHFNKKNGASLPPQGDVKSEQTNTLLGPSKQPEPSGQPNTEDASGPRNTLESDRMGPGGKLLEMPKLLEEGSSQGKKIPTKPKLKARPAMSSSIVLRRSSRLPDDCLPSITTKTDNEQEPRKMIKVRADGRLTSPKGTKLEGESSAINIHEAPLSAGNILPAARSLTRKLSPDMEAAPRKLMKVRSDGKLASPKSHALPELAEKKRRGRPKKSASVATDLIVVLKYGKINSLKQSLGQRIERILSGSQDRLPTSPASNRAIKPSEPLKTTHPFFLGNLSKKPKAESLATEDKANSDASLGKQGGSECSSNPVKRSPKKAAAKVNASAWTCMGAFGQPPSDLRGPVIGRSRGTFDTIWPPQDMVHIRQISEINPAYGSKRVSTFAKPSIATKLKDVRARITEKEEVTHPYTALVQSHRAIEGKLRQKPCQPTSLRVPTRRVMKGHELQSRSKKRVDAQSRIQEQSTEVENDSIDESSAAQHESIPSHPALLRLYDRIATSRTAFDRFECEIQDWQQKYAPRKAEEILQPGQEALVLRNWLRSLAVNSVDIGSDNADKSRNTTRTAKKPRAGLKNKKRHRAEELDGFVVSSDEEANEMDELDDGPCTDPCPPRDERKKKTEIRAHEVMNLNARPGEGQKPTNAVVVSGPCGCGKTAAIYAATQELDFEVFEINAGSRRSGKDILDRVGDMSRNHLVNQSRTSRVDHQDVPEGALSQMTDTLKQDIEIGRQGTMNAFLRPTEVKKRSPTKKRLPKQNDTIHKGYKQKAQKQSVILLEEVDVLFEEDRQFWATVVELIVQSKRPVIMTCTEESLLPLDDLPLFGILRFTQPPEQLATDYLTLLACNEGHLLSTDAVSALYRSKNDLRASITELQFFCQMGIGDIKGGLEWMLVVPAGEMNKTTKYRRVVSDGTYLRGMGWLDHKKTFSGPKQQVDEEIDDVLAVCNGWGIDVADQDDFLLTEGLFRSPNSPKDMRSDLRSLDLAYDALSAADTLRYAVFRDNLRATIEVSGPPMSEKQRANYVEGTILLEADIQPEPSGVSDLLAAALRIFARRTLRTTAESLQDNALCKQFIVGALPEMIKASKRSKAVTPQGLSAAFLPLSKPSVGMAATRGPSISSLDSQVSVVVEDIAPYIRSIVSYDLRLEQHRAQLDLAFHGERSSKRARTTRASRAALEGGSKANTRRERWFPADTDFQAVLGSGAIEWQEEALRMSGAGGFNANDDSGLSRRSSVGSAASMATMAQ
ncbi:MAG: hypothetical protein Q9209_003559 [Squamulea sp. 1 TL-2023]